MPTRREFIHSTSTLAAGAGLVSFTKPVAVKKTSAADKVGVALIGCRGMGFGDLSNALKIANVECVALCDVDKNVLEQRKNDVLKIQGKAPATYADFRKCLENKDIDAVIIGTPDHWHCLIFLAACEAGKDIYVEKPLANSIAECNIMLHAARKYNRVVQVGQQQRSGDHWKEAIQFIKDGKIGQLRKVNVWANFNYGIGEKVVPDGPVPVGVDYDMWLGPAPKRNFNAARFHGSWRMFWDYGGGLVTDWGVHLLDMALWAKDVNTFPLAVAAAGGNFAYSDHAHETFDTMSVSFQMKDWVINWENTAGIETGYYNKPYGLLFVGNDASIVINRDGWELLPETTGGKYKVPKLPFHEGGENHAEHMQNFIDCVRSRKDPACPIENGRLVAMYAHFANIALRTNSRVVWKEYTGNFGDNSAANALIKPEYRAPWKLPSE
jgi:predicted dehydrogenase